MSAVDYISKLDWPCPQCTVFNRYNDQICCVCGYLNTNNSNGTQTNYRNDLKNTTNQIKDLKLNNQQQQQQKIDSNNNNNLLRTAFNTLSNDFKNFISGLSPNNSKNSPTNPTSNGASNDDVIYDYTDNPDVIEIDPNTNRPIRPINTNNINDNSTSSKKTRRKLLPNTFSDPVQSSTRSDQWICSQCTYAANPEWSSKCEICSNDRSKVNKDMTNKKSSSNRNDDIDSAGLTIYDTSLNEEIYDYARIWTCSKCTLVNFKKDKECELCLTPRSQNNKILNESNHQDVKSNENNSKVSNQKENKWVCKKCTYLNSNTMVNCHVCNAPSSLLERTKQRNLINNSNNNNSNNIIIGNKEDWICQICSHRNKSSKTNCVVCLNLKDLMNYESSGSSNSAGIIENDDDDDDDNDVYYSSSIYNNANSSATRSGTLNPSSTFRSQKAKSIIKTYANATNQAERIWKNIVKYCQEQGHKFVDDSFPPCDKSLFIDPNKKPENLQLRNIQWLSPEYIRTHPDEYNLKWTVYNEPKFNDIKQGLLGNCWLLSGLAVIIEKPEMLRRIIITKDYCPQGCYQVRLCLNGEWQTVIVDDLFPCDSNGCLIYSQASRKQLWVPLIEKAMAKLNGNYESLIAGQTVEGLSTLTGYPCDSIRLEPSSSANEDDIDLEMIWARLVSMKDYGYSMGASCGRTDIKDDNIFTNKGLLPRHAYSVLNVKEINGNQLIQLRNPWGRYTWTGDWSDNSSKWTPDMRKICGVNAKASKTGKYSNGSHNQNDNHLYNHSNRRHNDQGVFWMSFNDFVQYFCSIDICKTRLDWYENRMTGYFNPEGTREMQAYHLVVFETSEIDIGLFHKTIKNRRENSDLDLCFVVLRSNGQRNSVGKFMFSSKHSVRKFIGCENIFEPGEYIIVPFSFNFWYTTNSSNKKSNEMSINTASVAASNSTMIKNESNNLYNLVLHSPKVFFLEQEMHSAFLLADTLIRFCVTKGSKTYSGLENACIYTLTKGFAGIVVVAENYNERAYLHVELDCEQSNNVVSTRQALITKDSVQPLHRQVLIVLTHLEGTTGYSIQYSIKYRLSSNPYLNTWPGMEGQMVTNLPPINKQTFGLHAPRSAFD